MIDFEVEVTEADIFLGERGSLLACPIAHAIDRQMQGNAKAQVGTNKIYISHTSLPVVSEFEVPEEAKNFIYWYDKLGIGAVKPFKFKLIKNKDLTSI